ncbi:hypothetical protein C8J95_102327 [Elizabethkingia sp. YR214]|nr:hypothetical protein C8J95_102327 [Elizabethkingia sp. YR214]
MSIRIGELIDSEVSQLLIDFTDRVDRAEASVSTGVGTSTLRDITYRTNVVIGILI